MTTPHMNLVWEADLPRPQKLVLLAIADHMSDDEGCFASYDRLAHRTGYEVRQVQRIIADLAETGILVLRGQHPEYATNIWDIDEEMLPKLPGFTYEVGGTTAKSRKRNWMLRDRAIQTYGILSARDGFRCRVPGCRNENLEIDHIIPRARGGTDDLDNLQLLCADHNTRKNARPWDDFLQEHWEHFQQAYVKTQGVLHEWNAIGFSIEDLT